MAHVLAKDLRDAVLQAAFEGRLVPQKTKFAENVNDLIDSELKIAKKNGYKLSNQKVNNNFDNDFNIPESWKINKLGNLVFNNGQKCPVDTFSYIDIGTLDNINHKLNDVENIISADKAPSRARKIVKQGDIIYSTVRPYLHNVCIIDKNFKCEPIASTGFAVMHPISLIYNKYLFYYLISPNFDIYSNNTENSKGVAYPSINDEKLYNALIPFPPFEEQQRIVAKVDELMAKIDEYEKLENELVELKKNFPGGMKDAVLQAAFKGELSRSNKTDSNVQIEIRNLNEIKVKLIKEKIIKKETPLSSLSTNDFLYDIPSHWCWVKLGEIIDCGSGSTPLKGNPKFYSNGTIPWLKTGELNNSLIIKNENFITEEALKSGSFRINKPGDILIAMYGATIGKLGICTFETTTNQACLGCTPYSLLNNMYLFYYFLSSRKNLICKAEGGAQPNISRVKIRNYPIPLPPIEEQQRIVEKLDQLLPLCDALCEA